MNDTPVLRTHAGQPPIAILGIPFDNLTASDAGELLSRMVASRRPHYLVSLDVGALVEAQRDGEWRAALHEANLVLGHDAWLARASRRLGEPVADRLLGNDLMPLLWRLSGERKFRVFLLANSSDGLNRGSAWLKEKHPQVFLAGGAVMAREDSIDDAETRQLIAAAKPDVLFVLRRALTGEKRIASQFRALNVPVCVGVSEHFYDGKAPCEIASPRGVGVFIKFAVGVLQQWWQLQFRRNKNQAQVSTPMESAETWQCIKLPPRLDLQATRDDALLVDQVLADGRDCVLDLAAVEFIDSTGMGLLIRLQKKVRASGQQLVLLAPSATVQRALKLMNLQGFFTAAPDLAGAREILNHRGSAV